MAMTGGTSKLLMTTHPFSDSSKAVQLYAYYKSTQSAETNKSTIYCGMYVTTPSGWGIGSWEDSSAGSYIGTTSNTFDGDIPNFSGTRWLVENKTFTVSHDADGKGKATIQWKWNVNSPWGGFVYPSGSFTVDLPTIARASVPTVSSSSVKMGSTVTINTNRKSSSFTHTIQYTFGGTTATIKTGVGASYVWTVPDLASKCNNAKSGTATITCITYNGGTEVGTKTCTITLNVPDATTPKFTNGTVTIGSGNPIELNAGSTNFTHTITYSFGGTSGTIAEKKKGNFLWWPSYDLAKLIKSSPTGSGTVTCTTYNGTASVGSVPVSFNAVVPDNDTTKPSFTESGFVLAPSGTLPSAFSGLYIKGKTGVRATFTATSVYSAISKYELVADSRLYTGNPATSSAITIDGNIQIVGTVTDARGYSRSVSKTIYVHPYSTPIIEPHTGQSRIICERSTLDGTYDDAGTYLHIKCKRKCSPVTVSGAQKNRCALKYQYKSGNGSWSSKTTLLDSANTSTDLYDGKLPNIVSDTGKSYTVRLIVEDTIGSSETYEFTIPTADVTLHLGKGGYGVAVGKYSEATANNKMFEVDGDWDFVLGGNPVVDFIVEQGTTGAWTWRKWNSGMADCWGIISVDAVINSDWGGMYVARVGSFALPITFSAAPICIPAATGGNTLIIANNGTATTTTTQPIVLVRPMEMANSTHTIQFIVHGRWK